MTVSLYDRMTDLETAMAAFYVRHRDSWLMHVEYNQPGGITMSTNPTVHGPDTLGPFGIGNQPGVPVQPSVVPPVPLNLAKYGDLTNPAVYMQGVTSTQDINGMPEVTQLDPLYFATWETGAEVMMLLGGIGLKPRNVNASQPQIMITISQHMLIKGKLQTVNVDYIAGLLANGLYHGDVTPLNASSLG
jgi:hypothetical protein